MNTAFSESFKREAEARERADMKARLLRIEHKLDELLEMSKPKTRKQRAETE